MWSPPPRPTATPSPTRRRKTAKSAVPASPKQPATKAAARPVPGRDSLSALGARSSVGAGPPIKSYGGHLRGSARSHHRLLLERRYLSPAPAWVARHARLALSKLRDARQALRQHPNPLLVAVAGALSQLRRADLAALSLRR